MSGNLKSHWILACLTSAFSIRLSTPFPLFFHSFVCLALVLGRLSCPGITRIHRYICLYFPSADIKGLLHRVQRSPFVLLRLALLSQASLKFAK